MNITPMNITLKQTLRTVHATSITTQPWGATACLCVTREAAKEKQQCEHTQQADDR